MGLFRKKGVKLGKATGCDLLLFACQIITTWECQVAIDSSGIPVDRNVSRNVPTNKLLILFKKCLLCITYTIMYLRIPLKDWRNITFDCRYDTFVVVP